LNWFERGPERVTLRVHAQPGAKRTEVVGLHGDSLKLRLASPPVDGKANACLIAFLAMKFGLRKNQLAIVRGASARQKTVLVSAPDVDPLILLPPDQATAITPKA